MFRKSVGDIKDSPFVQVAAVNLHAAGGIGIAAFGAYCRIHGTGNINKTLLNIGGDVMNLMQVLMFVATKHYKDYSIRLICFIICTFCAGMNVGTWITNALQDSGFCEGTGHWLVPDVDTLAEYFPKSWKLQAQCDPVAMNTVIMYVFLVCCGVYVSTSIATLFTWRRGMFKWFGYIVVDGLWILYGTYWLARLQLIDMIAFDTVYVKLGLCFYAVKIAHDTEVTMQAAYDGTLNILDRAVTTTFNFFHLFIRFIQFFGKSKRKG
jgi:hypothetical protein